MKKMLMMLLFLVLDESMPGWYPKAFKLGGVSNCSREPTKLVPLGTMLKNVSEYNAGMIVCNYVVQNP